MDPSRLQAAGVFAFRIRLDEPSPIRHHATMTKLGTWLDAQGITDEEFGKAIKVHPKSVWRYRRGDRIPTWDVMSRIAVATNHEVTANDWMGVKRRSVAGGGGSPGSSRTAAAQ